MVRESVITQISCKQKAGVLKRAGGLARLNLLKDVPQGFVSVITGVRRCGKSTLMEQRMRLAPDEAFYLNFESAALAGIDISDAARLDNAIAAANAKTLYFDEIQQFNGWERYVRTKLDEGFNIVATGSNASILGKELGTKLTGRHIDCELYPFDYEEYLAFTGAKPNAQSTLEYMRRGGFPAFLATGDERLLETLFDDLIVRDVAVRHGVHEIDTLRRLGAYLVENIGARISATRMKQPLAVASATTILKWCDAIANAYLFDFTAKFGYSAKVQMVNPRKVYCIDTGLQHALSASAAPDDARAFENLVYLALRRKYKTIRYFDDSKCECDFIPMSGKRILNPVQATVSLDSESEEREFGGVRAAMRALKCKTGWIVTLDEEDEFHTPEGNVKIVPFHKFSTTFE